MPEMPEVITVVNDLKVKILGKKITKLDIYKDKLIKEVSPLEFKKFLLNETIEDLYNIGKHIIFKLSNEKYLLSHLRMTGKYNTYKKMRSLEAHDYLVFSFDDNSTLYYNDARQFGTFHIRTKENLMTSNPLAKLAPTPDLINVDNLYQKIRRKSIPIKNLILDQSFVLGIGNIYANEALWATKIHPTTKTNKLTLEQLRNLIKAADEIMQESIKQGGSSIQSYSSVDGVRGNFQNFLKVHMKDNKPCPRCQTLIEKIYVGQRGTYYCPHCQKG
ncbi:bifunctional DNA-formamidopyrimidine glycosylase/DNA-(apurinic or apyrimidinic site) lyase [Mycoplasmopsis columbina]|uniref:bifunctional DNA-formamidopyrimidine glycosylase/DNA-(apurinic or apyrimidinic site) lyase n=1 Tax=Mycoplasmopsis columbina TaxID=114881 RepID=UPI0004A72AB8|nr:bifunctional DNA-formamidopyrimidine glycosylase/DNA-(apurinic or apyrimidinic site) lyase [Mycoplasmopsis columbina]VEU76830.1 DNA-formamidopyrimidine glycosylase [Mycoplasmopsis columbina]